LTKRDTSYDELRREVLQDTIARCAMRENELRRRLATELDKARLERSLSIRALAKSIRTSVSQVQRLLHREIGGSLMLSTVCRAADALGLEVQMRVRRQCSTPTGRKNAINEWRDDV
jgi:hypothetical protein